MVFTNKCPIRKAVIDACPHLKYISVLATGYNIVDYAYAWEKGIPVSNVPTYGTASVGQFAIALLLEICHHVAHHSEAVHAGRWEANPDWCFWDYPLIELAGKTMGIIGFGKIGQTTGRIAQAMGMTVLASGSRETEAGRAIADYVDRDTLLARSDVVVLHCPLFPETEGMINKGGAGSGRRAQFREGLRRRAGRGLHRADPGRQPAFKGEKLPHHAPHLLGAEGGAAAHSGLLGAESAILCGGRAHQRGQPPALRRGLPARGRHGILLGRTQDGGKRVDIFEELELQDCPYCGGVGLLEEENGWCWYAMCLDCGAQTASFEYKSPVERTEAARKAAHMWNIGKILRSGVGD